MGRGFLALVEDCLSVGCGWAEEVVVAKGGEERTRSPRMQTPGEMTQRPPRVMCWVPWSRARRETLLPVSVSSQSGLEEG